ncbi:AgmX/PglI C-terminal domain-containing protein [Aliikangiella sp. IMCC44359]|uniref:AgmX/PglI C-terminal domain-containing protein n=1 Tax=Aliikangiella sp. IMCC44359 TaxID=3459125 RepID=UPI00403AC67B
MSSTMTLQPLALDLALPWKPLLEQEEKFKKWSIRAAVLLLILFVAVPFLPVFEAELELKEKTLVRTKVVLKKKEIKVPEPEVVKSKPKPIAKPKPEKIKPKIKKEKAKPKLGNTEAESTKKKPISTKASVAQSHGLAKVSRELNALRGTLNVAGMKKKKITSKKAGVVATVSHKKLGENTANRKATGISVNESLMKGEVSKLTAHETTAVDGVVTEGVSNGSVEYRSYKSGQRDMESIRHTLEKVKGSIYVLYNRALDEYPDINGNFIFQMDILPSGEVTNLELVSSELELNSLEQRMLKRIKQISFGAEDVSTTSVTYTYRFFSS